MLLHQGAVDEAEAAVTEALGIDRALLGEDHPNVAIDRVMLADVLQARGAHELALAELAQARASFVAADYSERDYLVELLHTTAAAQTDLGRHDEALATLEAAHAEALVRFGPGHPELAMLDLKVGAAMVAVGEREAGLARAADGLTQVLAVSADDPELMELARAQMAELRARAARPAQVRRAQ